MCVHMCATPLVFAIVSRVCHVQDVVTGDTQTGLLTVQEEVEIYTDVK